MYADHNQTVIGDAVLILIMLSFFLIAFTSWLRLRLTGEVAILAPRVIVAALILAAFTGYFPRLVPVDPILLLGLHILLAVLAWGYALHSVIDLLDARRLQPPPGQAAAADVSAPTAASADSPGSSSTPG